MVRTRAGVWLKARRAEPARAQLRLMMVPFAAYLLLTPTVHPWYVLIVLAFLPFQAPRPAESLRRWLALGPWVYLSGAVALSYLTYLDPLDFRELEWVRQWEWWPALALAGVWVAGAVLPRRRPVE